MVKSNSLWNTFFADPEDSKVIRVHMDDPLAVHNLSSKVESFLENTPKKGSPIILCIGTDRSTGDCLGPLTGWRLTSLLHGMEVEIFGTIDQPVHANNLEENLAMIKHKMAVQPVIAIDACLGQLSSVGTILLDQDPLRPGAGLKKTLPPVGDLSLSGIVNIGGFMEFQVLQNTRLSVVFRLSQIIANSIFLALQRRRQVLINSG